jgi:alpha-beta hydrolase superfamily lysophospholipase
MGEHSARYRSLARFFVGCGYSVAALDHNGHGRSAGSPGDVRDFDDYVSDLARCHGIFAEQCPGVPVFLLGHSMGGLVAGCYLLEAQQRFAGAILSGAAIRTAGHPGKMLLLIIRLLALLAPRLGLKQLDANGVSRDPEVVREYATDPLVYHGRLGARLLREFFTGVGRLERQAASLTLPLLILHGNEDSMVLPEGSRALYTRASARDKTLKIYPGLFHEIFNEPEREAVLRDVVNWIDARLEPGGDNA